MSHADDGAVVEQSAVKVLSPNELGASTVQLDTPDTASESSMNSDAGDCVLDEAKGRYWRRKVNGRSVDNHRLIMEEILGRRLTRREVVHHKNGDPSDDRPENLEVMSLREHSRLHGLGHKPTGPTPKRTPRIPPPGPQVAKGFDLEAAIASRELVVVTESTEIEAVRAREVHGACLPNRCLAYTWSLERYRVQKRTAASLSGVREAI